MLLGWQLSCRPTVDRFWWLWPHFHQAWSPVLYHRPIECSRWWCAADSAVQKTIMFINVVTWKVLISFHYINYWEIFHQLLMKEMSTIIDEIFHHLSANSLIVIQYNIERHVLSILNSQNLLTAVYMYTVYLRKKTVLWIQNGVRYIYNPILNNRSKTIFQLLEI